MKSLITLLIFAACLFACSKEEVAPREYPRIVISEVERLSSTSARFYCEVIYLPSTATDHGFIWSSEQHPRLDNKFVEVKSLGSLDNIGIFEFTADNLVAGELYRIAAYAKSGKYIVYSESVFFDAK
jgi:hypothetical protein